MTKLDIAEGTYVEYNSDVYEIYDYNDDIVCLRATNGGCNKDIPMSDIENLTLLTDDDIIGYDMVTEEPIFANSDYETVYGFARYGSPTELGYILNITLDNDVAGRFVRCSCCDDLYDSEDSRFYDYFYEPDGACVCQSCYENSYFTCADCGGVYSNDEANEGSDGDYYCSECINHHRSGTHDYYYKPSPRFHDHTGDYRPRIPYMGVELEIDDGMDTLDTCNDLDEIGDSEDLFYLKHDGSLSSSGIEIVTHPCDLEYHLESFPWEEICETARSHSYKSHDAGTCGLHVHVSRDGLGDDKNEQELTVAKIVILFDKYWDELGNFSRRNYNQLNHWAKKPDAKIWSYDDEETAKEKARESGCHDRYVAVNLCNRNTVEFRLFRGTLKPSTIKATLQFLMNVIEFAKSHALIDVQEAKWSDFAKYREYPELTAYLTDRGLIEVPDKPKPVEPKQITKRFKPDSVVWFATSNTFDQPMRGTVLNVYCDSTDTNGQPLYVVEDYNGNMNFLIDDEIFDDQRIADFESRFAVSDDALINAMVDAARAYDAAHGGDSSVEEVPAVSEAPAESMSEAPAEAEAVLA